MSHLLVIDAGNTRLKWALHDGGGWVKKGAIPVAEVARPERLGDEWTNLGITRAVVSNVAGNAITVAVERALQPLAVVPQFIISKHEQCGVINRYIVPEQLGSDRWGALIAARHMALPGTDVLVPRLVIMTGTALTIDALSAEGEFSGGIILPGLALMRAALNRGTARLPAEPGEYEMFPKSTLSAIATGAVEASMGAIMRMHAHLAARTGFSPICILSGGASGLLIPHLKSLSFPVSFNENLVLDGLLAISAEMNSRKNG